MTTKPKKTRTDTLFEPEEIEVVEQPSNSSEEYVTFKRSHFYSILVVLAFAVGILVGYVAWGRDAAPKVAAAENNGQPAAAQVPEAAPQYVRYDIPTAGYPSLGPADAPITIVEFSDFQCPFCRRFQQETYRALLDAYPGKIRFVYRNLPLTAIHPDAMPAAIAALCANDQNGFWDYHDKLFSSETLDTATYIQYAKDLNLDADKFTACLSSGEHDAFIQEDMDFSINLGVQSTPTFFVNGLALVGAQPLASFTQLIDKELAGEIPQ